MNVGIKSFSKKMAKKAENDKKAARFMARNGTEIEADKICFWNKKQIKRK